MTSPCEVHIYCNDAIKSREIAKKILIMAKELEKKYNFYDPHSYLSKLNQRKTDTLDRQTKALLSRAKLFYNQTDGIFDITIGTLTKSRKLPTIEAINKESKKLLPFVGVTHFKIDRDKLSFDNPYTLIDLGGFVKEFAVDEAIKILKKAKIKSALVNFGGDIYALGHKPNNQPFSIGIKNPLYPKEDLTSVFLSNQALTTSASYERHHTIENEEYSHIISKERLQKEILSVTVISSNTLQSGVFSTALMIKPILVTPLKKILILNSLEIRE